MISDMYFITKIIPKGDGKEIEHTEKAIYEIFNKLSSNSSYLNDSFILEHSSKEREFVQKLIN